MSININKVVETTLRGQYTIGKTRTASGKTALIDMAAQSVVGYFWEFAGFTVIQIASPSSLVKRNVSSPVGSMTFLSLTAVYAAYYTMFGPISVYRDGSVVGLRLAFSEEAKIPYIEEARSYTEQLRKLFCPQKNVLITFKFP